MDARARLGLAVIGIPVYAFACHEAMTRAPDAVLTLALVLGPMAFALLGAAWSGGQRRLAGAMAVVAVVALIASSQGRGVPSEWLYFAQHAGLHVALATWFASSLKGEAMITQIASRLHALTPDMRRYTRQCTVAWVIYFLGVAAVSALLFVAAPFEAWSLFANLLTPLSLLAMFAGEHVVRYRLHPEFERVTLGAAMRAFSSR